MPSVYNYLGAINRRYFIYLSMNDLTVYEVRKEDLACCRAHAHKAAAPKRESETKENGY